MSMLYSKVREADAVLLASPAYMGGLASRMQVFMERTWPLRLDLRGARIAGPAHHQRQHPDPLAIVELI